MSLRFDWTTRRLRKLAKLRASGWTNRAIAEHFKVSVSLVEKKAMACGLPRRAAGRYRPAEGQTDAPKPVAVSKPPAVVMSKRQSAGKPDCKWPSHSDPARDMHVCCRATVASVMSCDVG